MGLTLHYELRLPALTTRESAAAKLRELHAFAATLPFDKLSPLLLDDGEHSTSDGEWREALRFWASIVAHPFDDDSPKLTGEPNSAMAFFFYPGAGCEPASFGLLRRSNAMGDNVDWYWYCSSKTQYASNVSEGHFVSCHTTIVRILEQAIASGIEVVVSDEGEYWETRNEALLLKHVRKMNTLVAGVAGRFSDALGDAHNVQAPIFEHPRFERLEMGEGE